MAKHPASHKGESNEELQQRTFPAKIKAVRAKANAALKANAASGKDFKGLSVKEKGVHQRALKAADRIEARLTNPSGGKKANTAAAAQKSVKKPAKKKKQTPAEGRREAIEQKTGTDKIIIPLKGVSALVKAARK